MTTTILPADSLAPRQIDPAFREEAVAAMAKGHVVALWDDVTQQLRAIAEQETAIYRGWMLSPEDYRKLHDAAVAAGLRPITSPEQYETAHYLPRWVDKLEGLTAETVMVPAGSSIEVLMEALAPFDGAPVVLKDWVKSRKHEWDTACFIPDSRDAKRVLEVTRRFEELQGEFLTGGLCFRRYLPIRRIGKHPVSGMPLSDELRVFCVNGRKVAYRYWDGEAVDESEVPVVVDEALRRLDLPFVAIDVALLEPGGFTIVEVGDGQVSGLPEGADGGRLYEALSAPRVQPAA